MMKHLALLALLVVTQATAQTNPPPMPTTTIRYAAIGDSYSNGEGATPSDSWPALLARHLTQTGQPTTLVANPSRTGWTTKQAIDHELPLWRAAHPDFATLQIGVNDWVQGIDRKTFEQHLNTLLDAMQATIPDTNRLLLVTIPDFSATPTGAQYANGRDITKGIAEFNTIIQQQAAQRRLKVIDIFPLTQKMRDHPTLIAPDGLHPSAQEYQLWETLIFPTAQTLLKTPPQTP